MDRVVVLSAVLLAFVSALLLVVAAFDRQWVVAAVWAVVLGLAGLMYGSARRRIRRAR